VSLRPYQDRAIAGLRASYARGKRSPCLVLPTGAGKTVVAASIIRSATERGRRVLFLAHREELISQSVNKLEQAGVTDIRVIQASRQLGRPSSPVCVASIPTLTKWIDRMPTADLVVFDECHHTIARTWQDIARAYPAAHLLGLTATPQRGDGKPLGDVFDDLVVGATVRELTDLGHLVPCQVWSPPQRLDARELALSPVQAYQQHGQDRRCVVFTSTVEHADRLMAEFVAGGVTCDVVHGGLPKAERKRRLDDLASGALRVVVNVHVLTEGWDCPAVAVCILARKPVHVGTYLQMVGRVLRPAQGKDHALLLDLCGSSLEHGPPDFDRTYSLDGEGISTAGREAIRQCPYCGAVFAATGQTTCPQCLADLPGRPIADPVVANVGLVKMAPSVDQLWLNLQAVARRARKSPEWVERAYMTIMRRAPVRRAA
jgi:superfamily II DNA or RNA helicase